MATVESLFKVADGWVTGYIWLRHQSKWTVSAFPFPSPPYSKYFLVLAFETKTESPASVRIMLK